MGLHEWWRPRAERGQDAAFRTLDRGKHPLRKVIVHLDHVRHGEKVAGRATYLGYVGISTGVSKEFSASLNFDL